MLLNNKMGSETKRTSKVTLSIKSYRATVETLLVNNRTMSEKIREIVEYLAKIDKKLKQTKEQET